MALPFLGLLLFVLPQGQNQDFSISGSAQELLLWAQDARTDADHRSALLLELCRRDRAISYELLVPIERRVRRIGVAPYVQCLGLAGQAAAEDLVRFLSHRDPAVQAEAIYAFVKVAAPGAVSRARAMLSNPRQAIEPRVAALRALRDSRSPFARVEALRLLPDLPGSVVVEAIRVFEAQGSRSDIPFLIDALEEQSGRGQAEILGLLQKWTGYRMGVDVKAWRYWERRHNAQGTPFLAPNSDAARANQEESTLAYLGIPILSDRLVFVIDFSGSMNAAMPVFSATTGSGLIGGATRSQKAVSELVDLLPRLPATTKFSIVLFANDTRSFSPSLVAHSPESVSRATQWLQSRPVGGGTNLYGGLQAAFDFEGAEEIVLLSDGQPSVGSVTKLSDIAKSVSMWNRWRNLRLSTIALAPGKRLKAQLVQMSADNGGESRIIEGSKR